MVTIAEDPVAIMIDRELPKRPLAACRQRTTVVLFCETGAVCRCLLGFWRLIIFCGNESTF